MPSSTPGEAADVVIANALVVDGTGAPGAQGDVVVVGDRISQVLSPRSGHPAVTVIDGTGMVLAPGFIDVHTHDDWALLLAPDHRCKTLQGVTSVVTGNCGTSPFPQSSPGVKGGFDGGFARYRHYAEALEEAGPSVNVAALVGHGAIREMVVGLRANRRADQAEMAEMARLLEVALDDGVVGMSSGLAYEPGRYADITELAELNRMVAAAGGVYTTHMRDEADGLLAAIDEALEVARTAGVRLQISHLKAAGANNWGKVVEAMEKIAEARALGVEVLVDQYPYTRGSTILEQVVRSGALDGPSPFGHLTPQQVLIAAAPRHPEWEGHTVAEIAANAGEDPRAMANEIVVAEGRGCVVVVDMMDEQDIQTVLTDHHTLIGSDGIPAGEKAHPRLGHTFPRVLGRYQRDLGILELPEIVHRMTLRSAQWFGLVDRGKITPGAYADLVLFDPATIGDTGTYTEPDTPPTGVVHVWVNGRQVVERGAPTSNRSGRVLLR